MRQVVFLLAHNDSHSTNSGSTHSGFSLSEIDSSWHSLFIPHISDIDTILASINEEEITPKRQQIFAAFSLPLEQVKILILGQDPYPGNGVADGLAFSTSEASAIPASLRNIFIEYCNDLQFSSPINGSLKNWQREGVLLLNTSLTTRVGERDRHKGLGWEKLISAVVKELSRRDVVAILWGHSARSLGASFKYKVESVHPSPLSAYRGFFGSRPFTQANELLISLAKDSVDWRLP